MSAKIPAKPSKDTIYVDVDDEITSIIDKVENSGHKVVALVLPKRAASLQSIVNMKLLKRSADSANKNVVLITSEQALIPLAGAAGLHVAKNLQSRPEVPDSPAPAAHKAAEAGDAEEIPDDGPSEEDLPGKFNYDKPIGALAAKHEADNPETIDLEDEDDDKPAAAAAAKTGKGKLKVPNFDRFRMLLGLGGLALLALIIFIIMAVTVLPKASVTITTSSEPVNANFDLTASTKADSLDTKEGILPAKVETTKQTASQQVTATGQKNNGDKATGSVTFSIPCGSVGSTPPSIPAGTGVSTNGLTYITQSNASLTNPDFTPSCHFTDTTEIKASAAGSKYNVGDSTFTISGGSYPNVSASGSASGGTDDIVTILSQGDVDNVKQKLTSGTTDEDFIKDFEKKLTGQGDYVLSSTLKTGDAKISATPEVGQPASTANVTATITYTVMTVKKEDLSNAIQAKLAGQIDKTRQKLSDSFFDDADITVQNQNSKTAEIQVAESTTAVPIINVASVKAVAKGHKSGEVKSSIGNWPGVRSVDVKLSPFWVSKVPGKDSKITVILKQIKDNPSNSAQP